MRRLQRWGTWASEQLTRSASARPAFSSVVPAAPTGDLPHSDVSIAMQGSNGNPLDGAWGMMDYHGSCSILPEHMRFFIIRGRELITASGKTRMSQHASRRGAYCLADAIIELDSNDVLRVLRAGVCKYYRPLQIPSEATLASLQGKWLRDKRSLFQSHQQQRQTLAIQGAFWQDGKRRKHQGIVYVHAADGSVMIGGKKVSIGSNGNLMLKVSGGRRIIFSKVFQPNLLSISET